MVHADRLRAVAAPAADRTVLSLLKLSAEGSRSKLRVAQDDWSFTLSLPGSSLRGCHVCSLDGVVKGELKPVPYNSEQRLRERSFAFQLRTDGGVA